MVCQPSITAVTLYFKEKRSFATGLSLCGNGLGLFAMSPLTEWLLQQYTWSGTFLIQGALLMNGIVCGLVYRPLSIKYYTKDDQITIKRKTSIVLANEETVLKDHLPYETSDREYERQYGIDDKAGTKSTKKDSTKANEHNISETKPLDSTFSSTFGSQSADKIRDLKKFVKNVLVETFDMSLLLDAPFCLYTISSAIYSFAYYIPFIYLPDLANHAGR